MKKSKLKKFIGFGAVLLLAVSCSNKKSNSFVHYKVSEGSDGSSVREEFYDNGFIKEKNTYNTDGFSNKYNYDEKGHLISEFLYNKGKEIESIIYTYNEKGHLTSVAKDNSDSKNLTQYNYNHSGLIESETEYLPNGEISYSINYKYSKTNQIVYEIENNREGSVIREYNDNGDLVSLTKNDINGNLLEKIDYTISFVYY